MAKEHNVFNQPEAQNQGTEAEPQTAEVNTPAEKPQEKPAEKPQASKSDDGAEFTVVCEARKGKTISAVSGKPIVFNDKGEAKAGKADAEYLKNCPGFTVK